MAPSLSRGGIRKRRRLVLVAAAMAASLGILVAETGHAAAQHVATKTGPRQISAKTIGTAPPPSASPTSPSLLTLQAELNAVASNTNVQVSINLEELGGPNRTSWSLGGSASFTAASTYKFPLLMDEAQQIAAGQISPSDLLCYQDADYQDGYYEDYVDGACYARSELMERTGQYSDNTAAAILVRYLGGASSLNAYASSLGATGSQFWDPNTTTANDLATLWTAEADGSAGGAAAQAILYPLLTNTYYESGIPAGVPSSATVVHKVGELDTLTHDAALVQGSPNGDYVLVVMTDGGGGQNWPLIAQVSQDVWNYEVAR